VFKVFLTFLCFFAGTFPALAQQSVLMDEETSQENLLSKYTNARAICARMTDPVALHERGMLLISDENDEAYLAAADCFMSAAMRNHTPSQIELGKLYENGLGVSHSDIFAYKWYQTAVLLGSKSAVNLRNRLENKMSIEDITLALPMIQNTLDLLDQYNKRREDELEKKEKELANRYQELFGIRLSDFETPDEARETKVENPLIEALIQAQLQKEAQQKTPQNQGPSMFNPGQEPDMTAPQESEAVLRRKSLFSLPPAPVQEPPLMP
jgi:hypothetical protein